MYIKVIFPFQMSDLRIISYSIKKTIFNEFVKVNSLEILKKFANAAIHENFWMRKFLTLSN